MAIADWCIDYWSSGLDISQWIDVTKNKEAQERCEERARFMINKNKELEEKMKKNPDAETYYVGFEPKRILKSGDRTIVFWDDGTKTIVKRGENTEDSTYAAFTAALAIRIFGSNSALNRIVERKTEVQYGKKELNAILSGMTSAAEAADSFNKLGKAFAGNGDCK